MQQQQFDHAIHGKKMQKILEGQKSLDKLKEFFEGQDYGNIVHFEHINLEVPDMEIARLFYGEGLGLTMDPGTTGKQRGGAQVLWFNIGRQQFHIAKGPVAQHVNGRVCLFVPDTDIVYDNLQYVRDLLKDTKFEFHKEEQGLLEIVDPWGNVFSVMDARYDPSQNEPCIDLIELHCTQNSLVYIQEFYESYFQAITYFDQGNNELWVNFGPLTKLRFIGQQNDGESNLQQNGYQNIPYDGCHVALYVANLQRVFRNLESAGLLLMDHQYQDKCRTLEDLRTLKQLRVLDFKDKDEKCVFQLHHEVRGLNHPQIRRNLYNRWGSNFDAKRP